MDVINVTRYNPELHREKWERFLKTTYNGTFLQSRNFLEYHGDRFVDHSLLFLRGTELVALCPACEIEQDGKKRFLSHVGSTFGGILIGEPFYTISNTGIIVDALEEYLKANGFNECLLKITGEMFCTDNNDLLYYNLFARHFEYYDELSFGIPLKGVDPNNVPSVFKSKTRNLYKTSLKSNLTFKTFSSREDVERFHALLAESLSRHDAKPVHSVDELIDIAQNRFPEIVKFYGAYAEDGTLVSASMVFIINDSFHTQYLCSSYEHLYLKPMDFLVGQLIEEAVKGGYKFFSFGISTEDHGAVLNENLAKFKEGFGSKCYINKTYFKDF